MTLTSEQSIDAGVARFIEQRDAWIAANPDALFMDFDRVVCIKSECAGMTLQGSILTARKGQKNFTNAWGAKAQRLSDADIIEWRIEMLKLGITDMCECGAVKV